MTYRGIVSKGVVLLEGDKPEDGTIVEVTPVTDARSNDLARHPAIGIWKDRTDLPEDAVEASKLLREKLMAREDE
jgi:hypothetical protein